jgi:hypothetical protein
MSGSRPSEKLGTHSISFCMAMGVLTGFTRLAGLQGQSGVRFNKE